jgi:hypothetical protein
LPESDLRMFRTLNWIWVACMAGNTQLVCHALAYENALFVKLL